MYGHKNLNDSHNCHDENHDEVETYPDHRKKHSLNYKLTRLQNTFSYDQKSFGTFWVTGN